MIQPIVVRRINDYYELIAGERRFRAAKIAGLKKLPAIIKDFDKSTAFEVALIENIQRKDLNPIEEAESFYKQSLDSAKKKLQKRLEKVVLLLQMQYVY